MLTNVKDLLGNWPNRIFLLITLCWVAWMLQQFDHLMDGYEKVMAVILPLMWFWLAASWRPLQWLSYSVGFGVWVGAWVYGGQIDQGTQPLLKYVLASPSAVVWMGVLVVMACVTYWGALFVPRQVSETFFRVGRGILWMAIWAGWIAFFMRWHESYLIAIDIGHVPVSNLYEVFVLFILITAMLYLFYEVRYQVSAIGGFVLLVLSVSVGFLFWYASTRGAHAITGLQPALKSWWMKIHVPANFVGYGAFSIAAMVAFAALLKRYRENRLALRILFVLAALLFLEPLVFRRQFDWGSLPIYLGVAVLLTGILFAFRRTVVRRLPRFEVLDELMQQSIAFGFLFFTLATILGATWAADAWGAYWQWDPKETWALVVWLNYAAWLHLRLIKKHRHVWLYWWALIGLLLTSFAFLGVNIVLSGLHSYGKL
jgi:cytochrome c-type biogenesis protein CcsB